MRRLQFQLLVYMVCVGAAYGLLDPRQTQACGRWRCCGFGGLWCGSGCFGGCGFARVRFPRRFGFGCGCWGASVFACGSPCGETCGSCGSYGSYAGYDGSWGGVSAGGGGGCGCGGGAPAYGGQFPAPAYDHGPAGPAWNPGQPQPYSLPPAYGPPGPNPASAPGIIHPIPEGLGPQAPGPVSGPMSARPIPGHRDAQIVRADTGIRHASQSVQLPKQQTNSLNSGIVVYVPEEAKLFVNGHQMKSAGEIRRFVARNLQRGKTYGYELRAEMVRNGAKLVRKESVDLKGGRFEEVAFDFTDTVAMARPVAESNPETQLTVVVPVDATVYLDGADTVSVGNVRKFVTNDIARGNTWKDYEVRVEFERDGKKIVKTRKVTLLAGEKQEVEIEIGQHVASSN